MISVNFLGTPDDPIWFADVFVRDARYRVPLGRISAERAEIARQLLEQAITAHCAGLPVPQAAAEFLDSIPDVFHERLCLAGIIPGRRNAEATAEATAENFPADLWAALGVRERLALIAAGEAFRTR